MPSMGPRSRPAVIHWMSPDAMAPRFPRLSPCSTVPARTYVMVSMPRCGCQGETRQVVLWHVVAKIIEQKERIVVRCLAKSERRCRWTPAPSSVGLAAVSFLTGRMDVSALLIGLVPFLKKGPDERTHRDNLQSLDMGGVDRRLRESGGKTSAAQYRRHFRVQQREGVGTPFVDQHRGLTVNGELELVSFAVVGDCRKLRFNAGIDPSHYAPSSLESVSRQRQSFDSEFLHLELQRAAVEAQPLRGPTRSGLHPITVIQHRQDMRALVSSSVPGAAGPGRANALADFRYVNIKAVARGANDRMLDQVLQFADVAGSAI
jgi:hypothetical protein